MGHRFSVFRRGSISSKTFGITAERLIGEPMEFNCRLSKGRYLWSEPVAANLDILSGSLVAEDTGECLLQYKGRFGGVAFFSMASGELLCTSPSAKTILGRSNGRLLFWMKISCFAIRSPVCIGTVQKGFPIYIPIAVFLSTFYSD
ncbi:hypothetical protein [Rhodopirellula europaea]|uniref:hypothetical protein n=1 Tax=Rhodopirellula europaea TaxID=1263866 RepID=UPI003D27E781